MDDFLQQGEQGGQNAATQLSTALEDYISSNFPSITTPKIMTKIYANVKGLSDLCVKGGIINEPTLLDDFVRGFNGTVPLFDLVDIGAGNDKAHDKIGGRQSDPLSSYGVGTILPCILVRLRELHNSQITGLSCNSDFRVNANVLISHQRSSKFIYTIAIVIRSFWGAQTIVNMLRFWKIHWKIGIS